MGEGGGSSLCLNDTLAKETSSPYNVLSKQLSDYHSYVGTVNLHRDFIKKGNKVA